MDLKELKALLKLLEGTDLEELEIEEAGRRIRLRRRAGDGEMVRPAAREGGMLTAPTAITASLSAPDTTGFTPVTSPMIGTFYRAPAPGAAPYVKEGDVIQKGTVVCIIEAMKLMNEIEAEVAGRVARTLVENGQTVEFGQPLFLIAPA
jgi:acetyl-CoA carboxylase biotin carboxyl carrier protein